MLIKRWLLCGTLNRKPASSRYHTRQGFQRIRLPQARTRLGHSAQLLTTHIQQQHGKYTSLLSAAPPTCTQETVHGCYVVKPCTTWSYAVPATCQDNTGVYSPHDRTTPDAAAVRCSACKTLLQHAECSYADIFLSPRIRRCSLWYV
jgi:hypothetical protein